MQQHTLKWTHLAFMRRIQRPVSSLALFAMVLTLIPALALADGDSRVAIEYAEFDAKENTLTLNADILDVKGVPIDKLEAGDLEILANGKPLKTLSVDMQTSDKAQESIAVVILLNASRAYGGQDDDPLTAYRRVTEGAGQFIQRLTGNDKVAVLRYRESFPYEMIYDFASAFNQAKDAVISDSVKDAPTANDAVKGEAKGKDELTPESIKAIDRALQYMTENAKKLGACRRKFLIVASDGKNRSTNKSQLEKQLKNTLEKYEDQKIRIHAIGFSDDDQQYLPLLQTAANATGGKYIKVEQKDKAGIPAEFDKIAIGIKKQWQIKVKLAELPDWGDVVKGKDEKNYNLMLRVKMKDGATSEATFNDIRMPAPSLDIMKWVILVGKIIGAIIGVVLFIVLIVWLIKRKKAEPQGQGGQQQQQQYDGPSRGKLVVLQGPLAGTVFPLIDDVTTIGSMKGNTLVIEDGSVSRRHAAIKIDDMRFEVADLNSTNGVLVNGQKVHKVFLRDGDSIQIGTTEMQFKLK